MHSIRRPGWEAIGSGWLGRGRLAAACALVGIVAFDPAPPPASAQGAVEGLFELEAGADPPIRKHRKRQNRPIKMGTSGGNIADFTLDPPFITCCSGTLGALLEKSTRPDELFILSNNHVLARLNKAEAGEGVSQPGRIDNGCQAPEGDHVGVVTGYRELKLDPATNAVDAAIAVATPGSVDESGAILGIGVPGRSVAQPRIGMAVQKSGRTTGVTRGRIFAINARVRVRYKSDCAEAYSLVSATFVKQLIIVSHTGELFSAGGDSGAAVLEDVETCPSYVGLFFAGNSSISVANRMSTVLKEVKKMQPRGKAGFVGCEQPAAAARAPEGLPELSERDLRLTKRVQARVEDVILGLDGVHAMGIGRSISRPDAPAFKVFADTTRAGLAGVIPDRIDGIPVEVVHSGPIYAQGGMRCSAR